MRRSPGPAGTLACAVLAGVLAAQAASAQYPGQYPPGQYPPGQYPPSQYPNTYPTRLPGGIPVSIPVPEVKLPKKQDKKSDGVKMTLASVEGTLRRMNEKHLLLETAPRRVLRFRLLAKTQFKDKEGEGVRDSLLRPGDRLSIEVNTGDVETALKVVLLRNGTPAPKSTSART